LDKDATTALSISRWIASLRGPWKIVVSGSEDMNWVKVAFDCEIQIVVPGPKSPTYATPNVIVIVFAVGLRSHVSGARGKADVVIVLPSGMTTLIRVPPPMGEMLLRVVVGAPLQVSFSAVRSTPGPTPGHAPARINDGSVGHWKATGVAVGVAVLGGVVAGGVPGQPVKDRNISSTVATTASNLTVSILFMIILPRGFHRRSGAS
jgi:hypothetical protein